MGESGARVTPNHTYASTGIHVVTLTVTDDGGATAGTSQIVPVIESLPTVIALAVSGYKVKGLHKADLQWAGAVSEAVDVYRDGTTVRRSPPPRTTASIPTRSTGAPPGPLACPG